MLGFPSRVPNARTAAPADGATPRSSLTRREPKAIEAGGPLKERTYSAVYVVDDDRAVWSEPWILRDQSTRSATAPLGWTRLRHTAGPVETPSSVGAA